MYISRWRLPIFVFLVCFGVYVGYAQTAQLGADLKGKGNLRLSIEKIVYRPARWEFEKVREYESEIVNKGGVITIFYRNTSDSPLRIKYWRWNGKDRSHWVLNHFVAWDRYINQIIEPNQLGVLEINAITEDFAEGKKFLLQMIDEQSRLSGRIEGTLFESVYRITFIRVYPEMKKLLVFFKNFSGHQIKLGKLSLEGYEISSAKWNKSILDPKEMAICEVELSSSLTQGEWFIVSVGIEDNKGNLLDRIYSHRRAFVDEFPIGVWTGTPETYESLYNLHIDTLVEGDSKESPFFKEIAPKYGFRAMVHTGVPTYVERVKEFSGHPHVVCWMIQDEPDWSIPSNLVFSAYEQLVRYDKTKPTFITLCRNIKFFEYAPICDIPCQDHYSVTAPSSSIWPKPYGTRLEETAYYTRDLKLASEPKPIWVWSQAIASWGERPKRPVPTPEELSAQLVLNLGRGAKGILWFNHEKKVAERYPELEREMQGWGRVMSLLKDLFLSSEPVDFVGDVDDKKVDVAPLEGINFMILCITNLDYEIHPEAYPFKEKQNIRMSLKTLLPIKTAFEIAPSGLKELNILTKKESVEINFPKLHSASVVLLHSEDIRNSLIQNWKEILEKEKVHLYPISN
ncbi:MAG: hypothetical protein N3G21_08565 [Candidatus Hydrogenedentes bacterium]|nr:hypothetical protein [Candidatus Hydrogenedentota bacterium]